MSPVKTFLVEPTNRGLQKLRRFAHGSKCPNCPKGSIHDGEVFLAEVPYGERTIAGQDSPFEIFPKDDPRWPKKCDLCDFLFEDDHAWQLRVERIWIRVDTGERMNWPHLPPGAIYRRSWMEDIGEDVGFDGRSYMCVCPDGHRWAIDSQASNCTRPGDKTHRCWIRHGEAPNFHVDKDGPTCNAGAGSIAAPGWHGFLHNGYLREDMEARKI